MATDALLSRLQILGQQLDADHSAGDVGSAAPLTQAREFLLTHLQEEPTLPYRGAELLELLTPSPHIHWHWEQERELVLEGLTLLHQLWLGQQR
ncbi:hypothetical protein HMJ29_18320 [Hymenobacter taeanensis]|uniref:Uncharacterized protein n=1 Tax=Hymenobacter taeanensis TaxID=2735321 RepID=A0A6M6BP08_9BACT|nr:MULTISPECIES: hypothetical protein [Hymenobacter]QJX48765.1 hypothetical protein HMJ29_18320 [Hymenobacter taeanensis]UOQ81730.1 hypothetical protein MUN83_02755 [Hymenobacter sp. 5414T-23]